MTSEEKVDARVQAKLNMYDYATFVETDIGVNLCTLNLRLLTVHSYNQEEKTGTIKHALEFRVERSMQQSKKWMKDRVTSSRRSSWGKPC